jgi:hypothetical protein
MKTIRKMFFFQLIDQLDYLNRKQHSQIIIAIFVIKKFRNQYTENCKFSQILEQQKLHKIRFKKKITRLFFQLAQYMKTYCLLLFLAFIIIFKWNDTNTGALGKR